MQKYVKHLYWQHIPQLPTRAAFNLFFECNFNFQNIRFMAEALKNVYTEDFIVQFLTSWKKVNPKINQALFIKEVFANNWETLELKARMSRIADCMMLLLQSDFEKSAKEVIKLCSQLIKDGHSKDSFEYMFIPEYIEKNGIDKLETSLYAFEQITQFTSCEFAIRPFIIKYPEATMLQMLSWSKHKHKNVRRFSSEGCRPMLPWAMALPSLKKDPSPIIPLLENLKNDNSLYVRKSVANNLNDISKNQAELVIQLAMNWKDNSDNTDWIVKHACRTLLKSGNPSVMKLFGYAKENQYAFDSFKINTPKVKFGDNLNFEFKISSLHQSEILMRLEFGVYFLKANGTKNRKVFKISERTLKAKEEVNINKNHSIKPISTRKYYEGEHAVSVIANGIEVAKGSFKLIF